MDETLAGPGAGCVAVAGAGTAADSVGHAVNNTSI